MLEVVGLTRTYPEFTLQADFLVQDGEFFSLLGPSGCGKTTLLRLIAGLERPDGGRVCLNGIDVSNLPAAERRIGLVFQDYALFPHMNVKENIAYGLTVQKREAKAIELRVEELLELFEIAHLGQREVGKLSGGERQRVALARALAPEPYAILLDEPFSALDYTLRRRLREELRALQRKAGFTAVFVTHHQEDALALSDRLAIMAEGRILQIGRPEQVYRFPKNQDVALFLGEANLLPGSVVGFNAGRIELEVFGKRLEVVDRGEEVYRIGQSVQIVVRPEDWVWGCPGGIVARVTGREYLGFASVCQVEWEGWTGRVLLSKETPLPREDTEVLLGIIPENAVLLV